MRWDESLTKRQEDRSNLDSPPDNEILAKFYEAIKHSWSIETSSGWLAENPARGQCNVTALVFNDHFDGEILKTPINNQWHFYNHLHGTRYDLTVEQFPEPPVYLDLPSNRAEALAGTLFKRYRIMARRVHLNLDLPLKPES